MNRILSHRFFKWFLLGFLLSGLALTIWLFFDRQQERRKHDPQYEISALIQSCRGKDSLKTAYLAELLALSFNRPTNLFQFDGKQGEKKLFNCPLIKQASIQKIQPATLYVHYEMRTPIAFIGDFKNAVIDEEGFLFPFTPFFTPKNLPVFYLGIAENDFQWGDQLNDLSSLILAKNIYHDLSQAHLPGVEIKSIDLVDAFSEKRGKRQIVVTLHAKSKDIIPSTKDQLFLLRWNPEQYHQCLQNLLTLEKNKSSLGEACSLTIIDQRIPHLALIKREN